MSGNAYGNLQKYKVTRSEKAFKDSARIETHQHQSQIIKIAPTSKKYQKSVKKSKELEKIAKVLGDIIETIEMEFAFY